MKKKLLFVDHHDSFSHNLRAALQCTGFEVHIVQSAALQTPFEFGATDWNVVVLSPGPGRPEHYPQSLALYQNIPAHIPVLGVCLGHQLMLHADVACVVQHAAFPVHGRQISLGAVSSRLLGKLGVQKPPQQNLVVLYNSLALFCDDPVFSQSWNVLAREQNQVLMAEHRVLPRLGVQFHPESFASTGGAHFLSSFAQFVEALR